MVFITETSIIIMDFAKYAHIISWLFSYNSWILEFNDYCQCPSTKFTLFSLSHGFVGTTKIKNLDSNIGSLRVKLSKEDLKEIADIIPVNGVAGYRTTDAFANCSWKFANTPAKESKLAE